MRYNPLFRNKLYICESLSGDGTFISARIRLLAGHPVFAGHFPGNPVLPGVCIIQIINEILSMAENRELHLVKAGGIKYISFIRPDEHPRFDVEIQCKNPGQDTIYCSARVFDGDTIFCTLKGEYALIP